MRVFVAGATGVLGRRVVTRLGDAGHEVTAVSRSPEKDAWLQSVGARPVRVDLFDPEALRTAVAGADAVVNIATKIPPIAKMATPHAWDENERIRRDASGNLVDAALAAGASVFVQESLAFMYGEHGDAWIEAGTTPLATTPFSGAIEAAESHVARFRAAGGRGVVLRFGRFYAPESDQARATVETARRGFLLDLGRPDVFFPLIDADDAATAVVAALTAPSATFDVVDEPTRRAEQSDALAAAVGRRRLWHAPSRFAPKQASYLTSSQRVSNRAFRDATGWRPSSPTVREGYRKLAGALHIEPARPAFSRLMLWLLAASALALGVQAEFFPRGFYDNFPFGRSWVAMDGRYNEHLIRDFGALNLALVVVTLGALYIGTRAVARLAGLAWIVYSVPHLVYHLRHLTMVMPGADKVGMVVSLSLPVVAGAVLVFDRGRRVRSFREVASAAESTNLTPVSVRR